MYQNYSPMTITNPPIPSLPPKKSQKGIVKTSDAPKNNKVIKTQSNLNQRSQWNSREEKQQLFDKNLKKQQIASQQRMLRAQSRKQANSKKKPIQRHQQIKAQQQILAKKYRKVIADEKNEQIQKLQKLVQLQRQQKQKNDRIYQERKKQLEKQREQLRKMEMNLIKNPPKVIKSTSKAEHQSIPSSYPQKDRSKCHQDKAPYQYNYPQPTQSQTITNSKNILRQKQIEQMLRDRDKLSQKIPSLNYHPTLIPLLSRASYKIISTHVSTLVQLLVDDLLIEQVLYLQEIERAQRSHMQKAKSQQILMDYQKQISSFMNDVREIEGKVGKYETLKFQDLYKPKQPYQAYQPKFTHKEDQQILNVYLQSDTIEQIHNRSEHFKKFVSNSTDYKKANIQMFEKCTEQLIDKAVATLAEQLDRGSKDFIDLVFRNQFK